MRRSLVVGIDYYDAISPLSGCVNDAYAVKAMLDRNSDGSVNFGCKMLVGTGPGKIVTRSELKEAVPSIYSIVPPNDGSALRHGHHFEPVAFVIDHGRGHHDAYSAGSWQRTYTRACGCRQRPRRHKEELIESERGWSGREAFVTMMQTADLGQGNDRSGPGRLNGSSIRCVLADRQVGP